MPMKFNAYHTKQTIVLKFFIYVIKMEIMFHEHLRKFNTQRKLIEFRMLFRINQNTIKHF